MERHVNRWAGGQVGRWARALAGTRHLPAVRLAHLPTFFLLGSLLPATTQAQFAGRWRLDLESSRPQLALLTLDSTGRGWQGSVLLEQPDSAALALSRITLRPETLSAASPAAGLSLELTGRNDTLNGTLKLGNTTYRAQARRLDRDEEFYPSPPAFLLRQMVLGSTQKNLRLPGRWIAAVKAQGLNQEGLRAGYVELALAAGLTPLTPDTLNAVGVFRAMGLFHRAEMIRSAAQSLERIRAGIRNDTLRARFDYLFRPAGTWLVDIHDVALARVRRTLPTVTWESARPALRAAGFLTDSLPGLEQIPLALYQLYALRESDSTAYRSRLTQLPAADAGSTQAVLALIDAYDNAAQWYQAALRMLLEQPVFAEDSGGSIAERVAAFWRVPMRVPEIRVHIYGYPEGATRIGADSVLARRLFRPLNAAAREWLGRHPTPDLFDAIHRLPALPAPTWIDNAGARCRITSVGETSAESFGGFLEPRDLILLDPSYQPLLALGTLVHEWQHLLHEHLRDGSSMTSAGSQVRLIQPNPYLAEGLAEWAAERILNPISSRYPLVRFGEVEKRMSLGEENPHVLGYAMIRAVESVLRDPRATLALIVKAGADPAAVLADPRISAPWSRYAAPDRLIPRRGGVGLIPETRFQLVDEQPDVLETLIFPPACDPRL